MAETPDNPGYPLVHPYSPTERLAYVDTEWEDIQDFIRKFSLVRHGTGKRNSKGDDLIRLKKIRKPNAKHQQDIEYLLKAKQLKRKS